MDMHSMPKVMGGMSPDMERTRGGNETEKMMAPTAGPGTKDDAGEIVGGGKTEIVPAASIPFGGK